MKKAKRPKHVDLSPSVLYVLAGATGALPIPFVSGRLAHHVRRDLVAGIARKHGVSLTKAATDLLATPETTESAHGFMSLLVGFASRKLLARTLPLALLPPLRSTWNAFVLGHLFERYLVGGGKDRPPVVTEGEAKRIRRAVDGALRRSLSRDLEVVKDAKKAVADEGGNLAQNVGRFVLHVPATLQSRLYAAFDELFEKEEEPKEKRTIEAPAQMAATA
ncbi:MAG TPA: hypothetical protein VF407_24710 [Polyangiaceae bacterium]